MHESQDAKRERLSLRWVMTLLGFLTVAVLAAGALLWFTRPQPVQIVIQPPQPTAPPTSTPLPGPLTIYVTGAVNFPEQTHTLPHGSRVQDAIDAAGGLTVNADLARVNLAAILRDGDHIHVFAQENVANTPAIAEETLPTPSGGERVHVNTASLEDLQLLSGIGPALAQRIIDYREANGPFANLEALTQVSGIGPATIEGFREQVAFD